MDWILNDVASIRMSRCHYFRRSVDAQLCGLLSRLVAAIGNQMEINHNRGSSNDCVLDAQGVPTEIPISSIVRRRGRTTANGHPKGINNAW